MRDSHRHLRLFAFQLTSILSGKKKITFTCRDNNFTSHAFILYQFWLDIHKKVFSLNRFHQTFYIVTFLFIEHNRTEHNEESFSEDIGWWIYFLELIKRMMKENNFSIIFFYSKSRISMTNKFEESSCVPLHPWFTSIFKRIKWFAWGLHKLN